MFYSLFNSFRMVIEQVEKNAQLQGNEKTNSETANRSDLESIQRFHNQINVNEMDFRAENYLSSSYWEAMSFLQTVRDVNATS